MTMLAPRRFSEDHLVLATHNAGKIAELSALLDGYVPTITSAAALNLPEPEETGDSFLANAELKARAAAQASGHPALADDSGLCVSALGGQPGIHAARYATRPDGQRDFQWGMQRLLTALEGHADRSAYFACVLALAWPDGHCESVEGRVYGQIAPAPSGTGGFGYDPVFIPQGYTESFGTLPPETKAAISHRAEALAQMIRRCFGA